MPAVGAIFSGIAATVGKSVIGGALLRVAVSVGLSKLAQRLQARRQRPPGQQVETQTAGETESERIIVGRWATEGHFTYSGSHGRAGRTPNAYLQMVFELSGSPVTALHGVILADEVIEFGPTHSEYGAEAENETLIERGNAHFWVKFYDGRQTAADPGLVARYGDAERAWPDTSVGRGMAYAIVTWLHNPKVWQGGVTAPRFVLDGIPLYDPRADSSRGGDGPQRHDDPATWAFTRNPVVIAYNVALGIPLPDGTVYGGGYALDDLPLDQWAAGMNEADARGWEFGAEIRVAEDDPADVIDACMAACAGQVAPVGGQLHIQIGEPREAVWSITDGDISADDPTSFEPIKGLQARHNSVTPSLICAEKLWEPMSLPMQRTPEWEAEDGGRLLPVALSLAGVSDQDQAAELGAILIADERRQRQHQIALPPDAARLRVMDVIEWTSPTNFYQDKLFEVAALELRTDDLFCVVTLREVDPDDYDPGEITLPEIAVTRPVVVAPQPVPGWAVQGASVTDAEGNPARPGLLMTWDPDAAEDVDTLRYEVRLFPGGAVVAEGVAAVEEGRALIQSVLPATPYEARGQLIADRRTDWTAWASATTPDIRLGPGDLTDPLIGQINNAFERHDEVLDSATGTIAELRGRIEEAFGSIALGEIPSIPLMEMVQIASARLRRTRDEINSLARRLMDVGLTDYLAREELRRDLQVQIGQNRASFSEIIETMTSSDAALVIRTTALEAETEALQSLIESVEIAFASETEALAALITALSVGTANSFDQLVIWRFDSTVQGWTGEPNDPAVTAPGFLRPGAGASSLISPGGLAWNTTTHRQVRALLRREGSPTWIGQLWYAGTWQDWDASRRLDIDEPDWVGGEAEIRVNIPGDLTIDRFRLDLASGVDGTDYIEADWIAVGSPSPGASSAELSQEIAARISADNALAALITALDVRMNSAESGLEGQVSITSGLIGQVEDIEGGLEATGGRVDDIEAVIEDPETGLTALSNVVEELTALVQNTEAGGLLVLAQGIRRLRAETQLIATNALGSALQSWASGQENARLLAEATQSIGARIEQTDEALTLTAQAVTKLQLVIPTLATVQALDVLQAAITVERDRITAEAQRTSALEVTVNHPTTGVAATATSLSQALIRITATEDGVEAVGERADTLELRVDDIDDEIEAAESAISTLQQTRITGAQATAISQSEISTSLSGTGNNTIGGRITNQVATRTTPGEALAAANQAISTSLSGTAAGTIGGRINTDIATRTTPAGAVAAVEQTISAEYGSMQALATATGFAEATADRIAAGFIWRAGTGGAIELVSVQNGTGGPTATARIRADYIRLAGTTEIQGTFIVPRWQSPNFVTGVSGARMLDNGNLEVNQLTARNGIIGRGPIARELTTRSFIQQAASFDTPMSSILTNTPAQFSGTATLGTISFSLPSSASDVPQLMVIRPFVGGRQPVIGNPPSGLYGIGYEFRVRIVRGGSTVFTGDWAFSPYWQFQWSNGSQLMRRVFYAGSEEQIRIYLENDGSGSLAPNDSIRVDFRIYMERSVLGSPAIRVDSETIEIDVEYFLR